MRAAATMLAALAVPAVAVFAPWAIRAWIETGHPLYPLFPDWFDIRPEFRVGAWMIRDWEASSTPEAFYFAMLEGDILLGAGLVGAALCLTMADRRAVFLGAAVLSAHLARASLHLVQWVRLFSVIVPLSALAAPLGFGGLPVHRRIRAAVLAVILLSALAMFFAKQSLFMRNPASAWDGWPKWTREAALAHVRDKDEFSGGRLELYEYLDRQTPPDARIVFSGARFVYHCPRWAIAPGEWNEDYLDTVARAVGRDANALIARLRREGVTHVVSTDAGAPRGADAIGGWLSGWELTRPHLVPLASFGRYRLYALPPAREAGSPPHSGAGRAKGEPRDETLR
jgi:hypothetical protein